MGARASIIIKMEGCQDSPILCQHWGGQEFHESVRTRVEELYPISPKVNRGRPENRMEPSRLFVKLVREFGDGGYVECDPRHVDDSDYGRLEITLFENLPPTFQKVY